MRVSHPACFDNRKEEVCRPAGVKKDRMSLNPGTAGFSIRKLIHQRQIWPNSVEESEEAFNRMRGKNLRLHDEPEQEGGGRTGPRKNHQASTSSSKSNSSGKNPNSVNTVRHAGDSAQTRLGNASSRHSGHTRSISSPSVPSPATFSTARWSSATHTRVSTESLRSDCDDGRNHGCSTSTHPKAHSRSLDEPNRPFYAQADATWPAQEQPSTIICDNARIPSIVTPTAPDLDFVHPENSKRSHRPRLAFANDRPSPPLESKELKARTSEPYLDVDCRATLFFDNEPDWGGSFMSDRVRQLIRETDDAFQAVNTALTEAKQTTGATSSSLVEEVRVQQPLRTPTFRAFPVITPQPPLVSPKQRRAPPPSALPPPPPSSVAPTDAGAGAARGVVGSPRKSQAPKSSRATKSSHTQTLPRTASQEPVAPNRLVLRPHHSYTRSLNKFNLAADKVTDKFFDGRGGRFVFHKKIQADEAVTPGQVQQFKANRLAKEAEARGCSVSVMGESASPSDTDNSDAAWLRSETTPLSPVVPVSWAESLSAPTNKETPYLSPQYNRSMTPPTDPDPLTKDDTVKRVQDPLLATPPATPPQLPFTLGTAAGTGETENELSMQQTSKLTPSKRQPGRSRSNSSTLHIPLLPTIPEVRITDPEQPRPPEEALFFHEDDKHMFFVSTPWTATAPAFQHGKIRLAKADVVHAVKINSLESRLLNRADETLDWTAFQMAILGGAGDLFNDPDRFLTRDTQDHHMVDELCDWLEDLGFSSSDLGTLVTTKPKDPSRPKPRPVPLKLKRNPRYRAARTDLTTPGSTSTTSTTTTASDDLSSTLCPQLIRTDSPPSSADSLAMTLPIPVASEYPSGFWNTTPFDEAQKQRFAAGSGSIKRWTLTLDGPSRKRPNVDAGKANHTKAGVYGCGARLDRPETDEKDETDLRGSGGSLPQSPMLDLRMTTAVDGTRELVPMGYNLGHDLGDFLKWEAEYVSASGYYVAD